MSDVLVCRSFLAHTKATPDEQIDTWVLMVVGQLAASRPGWICSVVAGRDDYFQRADALGGWEAWAPTVGSALGWDGSPLFDEMIIPVKLQLEVQGGSLVAKSIDSVIGRPTAVIAQSFLDAGKPVYLWGCRRAGDMVCLLDFAEVERIAPTNSDPKRSWAKWAFAQTGPGKQRPVIFRAAGDPSRYGPDTGAPTLAGAAPAPTSSTSPAGGSSPASVAALGARKILRVDAQALARAEADAQIRREQAIRERKAAEARAAQRAADAMARAAVAREEQRKAAKAAADWLKAEINPPMPPRAPAPMPRPQPRATSFDGVGDRAWQEFADDGRDLLQLIERVEGRNPKGAEFFAGARERASGMITWAEDNGRVTEKMIEALANIRAGVEKWNRR